MTSHLVCVWPEIRYLQKKRNWTYIHRRDAKATRSIYSFLADRNSKRLVQLDYEEKSNTQVSILYYFNVNRSWLKIIQPQLIQQVSLEKSQAAHWSTPPKSKLKDENIAQLVQAWRRKHNQLLTAKLSTHDYPCQSQMPSQMLSFKTFQTEHGLILLIQSGAETAFTVVLIVEK